MIHESLLERRGRTGQSVSLAEIMRAFSYALDLTEGQPAGHCVRACYIGMMVGAGLGLPPSRQHELFFTLLLKDLGCSSNAARIRELYETDDRAFKHQWKTIPAGLPATLRFVFAKSAQGAPLSRRFSVIANILKNGDAIAQEMIEARCSRGSDIAAGLGFSPATCSGIYHLDEHWDGSGRPSHLRGDAIPLYSRIALLAQIAEVFYSHGGPQAAIDEVTARSGSWLDPELVAAFRLIAGDGCLWRDLAAPSLETMLMGFAPPEDPLPVDEDYLDRIAEAFGQVIDAKSPYTAGHSFRVADYSEKLATALGLVPGRRRALRRAAALHDIGKLGVPNTILDKPGKLDDDEWVEMRSHAAHTSEVLSRIGAFSDMAALAGAHHERLDGKGYPLGLVDMEISRETRIITACDFYDALTADRPYRAAMDRAKALAIMEAEIGKAIDGDCFEVLRSIS